MNEINAPETALNEEENVQRADTDLVFYGVKDMARMMGCSIPTARDIMHRKDFPLLSVGNRLKVSKEAFSQWTMQRRT